MATLDFEFDPADQEAAQPFGLIPPGEYLAMISSTEMKQTRAGDGSMLVVEYTLIDGDYANRRLWDNLNLVNKSAKAEQIARSALTAICNAVGHVGKLSDSEVLHDIPLVLTVGVRKRDDNGEDKNVVLGWAAASGEPAAAAPRAPAPRAAAAKAPPPPAAAPGKAPPPWANKRVA